MERLKEKTYTYADLLSWADGKRYELFEGEPAALASPSISHQKICGEIYRQIANYLVGKKCEAYFAPVDVCLFGTKSDKPSDINTVVQPDIIVVCDSSKTIDHGCKGAPDLVIEILSPPTQENDRRVKYRLYQRAGVREYWIVDPSNRAVMVHTLNEGEYGASVIYLSQTEVPVSVLEDCRIDLRTVFPEES